MMHDVKVNQDPSLANKAVLYLRYSSEGQTENSIEGQRRDCEEFCKRNSLEILGEYVDRAISGTTDRRPDFQRMMRDSGRKVFGNVIVWKTDKFSRDTLDTISYRRQLAENGVKLLSATEPNMEGSSAVLYNSINYGYNQYYSLELSEKVKRGNRENVINGKHLGGVLQFGFKKTEDGRLVIDEKEGPIAQEIFRLYGESDMSILAICKKLKSEGKRRNDGREITHSCVEKMLQSEKYIGVIKCEGERNEHAISAIVSKELFDICQKKRTKRKHKNFLMRAGTPYVLSGKLFCEKCGSPYLGESGTSKSKKIYCYYKCSGAKHHVCDAKPIAKEALEETIAALVMAFLDDDETADMLADYIYGQQKQEDPSVVSMRKRKAEVDKQIANFAKAIGMGIITETTKSSLLALEAERNELKSSLAKASLKSKRYSRDEIRLAISDLATYGGETEKQREALINAFVKKVTIETGGYIKVELCLFGHDIKSKSGDSGEISVRIKSALPHHYRFYGSMH